jgi:trimeric autotransporter adhesin
MTAWQTTTGLNRRVIVIALLIALFACANVTNAFAQTNYSTATPAGTQIQNSASVSYQDQSNNNYSAQSTAVSTYVQQIDGYVITPATFTLNGVANENVAIKYVITNYSNGSEKIQLNMNNIAGVDLVSSSAHLYQDNANSPNAAAGDINGTSITIAQNGTYTFWFVGTMLSAADANNNKNFTVVGTDQGAPSIPAGATGNWTAPTLYAGAGTTSTVTVNLTTGAVINLTKAMSPSSGTGGALATTLSYSNPGARTATSVWVVDYLPTTTFTYTSGANVVWQGQTVTPGAGALSSAVTVGGQSFQAAYYNGVANKLNGLSTPALVFYIANVPFSASTNYTIQFPLATAAGLLPGTYTNTAQYAYADSVNATPATTTSVVNPCNTGAANTGNCLTTNAPYTLNHTYGATLSTTSTNPILSATAGNTVFFTELLTNTGNGNDTIQLATLNNLANAFPVGTTFTYFAADGVTGLTPTSGTNGTTGALFASPNLAPGGTYTYVIGVTLPSGYTTSSAISFNAQATTNAGAGSAVTATDTVNKVISAVDLLSGFSAGAFGTPTTGAATAGAAGGLGTGVGQGVIVAAPGVNPNASYTYELWIENNQVATDSFNIVASNTTTFSTSDTLPAGMSVAYFNATGATCSTLGTAITMPIASVATFTGANAKLVCAQVTVGAGFAAGTQNVYFQASSATTPSASDYAQDTFTTNSFYHVTVSSTSGQVNPGASVVYANTIINDGNQPITTVSFASGYVTDTPGGSPAGGVFNSTLYTNNTLATPITTSTTFSSLAVGGSVTIYAQVNAALQDQVGQNDSTLITVTYTTGSGTATAFGTDTTNVVSAINNVTVTKTQSLDAGCAGTPGTWAPATPSTSAVQAKPGDCVVYRISVTNNTGATVKNVFVSDPLNSYLTYCDGTAGTCGVGVAAGTWSNLGSSTVNAGSVGLAGNVVTSTSLNQVTSGQAAPYFQFEVKIK